MFVFIPMQPWDIIVIYFYRERDPKGKVPRTHKSQHAAKKDDEEMQKEYKLFTLCTELCLLCIRRKTFIIPANNLKKIKDLDSWEEIIWLSTSMY